MSEVWREVQDLRKAGQLDDAEALGRAAIAESSSDKFLRGALAWVYYSRLKLLVTALGERAKIKGIDPETARRIEGYLREYARLKPAIPDMCHSQILRLLGHIGRYLPAYGGFLEWAGSECFRKPDDFVKGQQDDKEFPSLATSVAREAAAWLLEDPERRGHLSDYVLALGEQAYGREGESVWLDWDLARIYEARRDPAHALQHIRRVLQTKSSDFWSWGEAAKILLLDGQRELAVSAYCRALLCRGADSFMVRVRLNLAGVLAEAGEHEWARAEINRVITAYQKNDWHYPKELTAILEADWLQDIDASALAGFDFEATYVRRAKAAIALLYDDAQEVHGCFVGVDPWSKRPRYAVVLAGGCKGVFGDIGDTVYTSLKPGAPVVALVGRTSEGVIVISIKADQGATDWDCIPASEDARTLDETSLRRFHGTFRATPHGFGFIEDVFVDAELAHEQLQNGCTADIVARRNFDKKKSAWGWKACAVISREVRSSSYA